MEFSSIEEANRFIKLKKIKLLETQCNLIRIGDSLYGEEQTVKNKI